MGLTLTNKTGVISIMKLEITVTADDEHHLGEALQKVVNRIGVGIKIGRAHV